MNNTKVTDQLDFYKGNNPSELIKEYGSPLYVYNEDIIINRCQELKSLINYKKFVVNYSAKANSNLAFLQIVNSQGLNVDAMSIGEMYVEELAGFKPENILFISNNVSEEEMLYAIERGIRVSVDSLSQLEMFGKINNGGEVVIRVNTGVGAGHHEKVITGGKNTKFGINSHYMPQVKEILAKYNLTLVGINQHIGSLFMEPDAYVNGVESLLEIAKNFDTLEFIDLGGGFGIPYRKQEDEKRLDLKLLGEEIEKFILSFVKEYGKEITLKIEPGRYISAESGVLLGTVHAVKENYDKKFIGTDLGFNVMLRPSMYDAHHELEVYNVNKEMETVTVVGNICETGDVLAKERVLPKMQEGDIIGVLDAGAYGHIMSSNYNNRLRPAEVLIRSDGTVKLIRERDTLEDLVKHYRKI